jgi:hypothetical protein
LASTKNSPLKRSKYLLELLVILVSVIGLNLYRVDPDLGGIGAIVAYVFLLAWGVVIFTK